MDKLKELLPYIIAICISLNILGNTIKMTLRIPTKYIVWLLLIISVLISFIFFKISFESLFIALISFSFSVSSYDLVKSSRKMIRKE